jgi:hypothetical protein
LRRAFRNPILVATWSALLVVALSSQPIAAAIPKNDLPPPLPVTFSDGSIATPFDHCGDADLCATIAYPNGDTLSLYSEGAAYCQPYLVHFVRVHDSKTLFEYSRALNHDAVTQSAFGVRCGNNKATQMTLDRGLVHLTVDEYPDGSLRFEFQTIDKKK